MSSPLYQALADAARTGEKICLALISGAKGSSPQKAGAKALFYPDGRILGTLGGGCLEAEIQQRAVQSLISGEASTFDLLLDHDFGWDDGLICGGKVAGVILPHATRAGHDFWTGLAARKSRIGWGVREDFSIGPVTGLWGEAKACEWHYRETISPPCHLWIAGAGHISQAVAPLARHLDFRVTVFDDRPALANRNFFPEGIELRTEEWEKLTLGTLPAEPCFGLVVTRGHRHDAVVLKEWIQKPFAFLGMIGSRRKARTICEHFVSEHLATPEQMSQVACPVGLPIQARSVPEIAVSILAQYIEKRAAFLGQLGQAEV